MKNLGSGLRLCEATLFMAPYYLKWHGWIVQITIGEIERRGRILGVGLRWGAGIAEPLTCALTRSQ